MSTSSSSTDPSSEPPLLEVGRIARAHGLRGEVAVVLTTDRTERLEPGSRLESDAGPLTVVAARPNRGRWLVSFAELSDRDAAEARQGDVLRAPPLDDPDVLWVHELIGTTVRSQDGIDRGVVVAVQANPAADLLELETGALVPLTFVVGGPDDGVLHVDVPDGLFDL